MISYKSATARLAGRRSRGTVGARKMRRISRPTVPPSYFQSQRIVQENRQLLVYLRREPDERRQRRDNLNEDLFHDYELRESLVQLFAGKCAFCETPIGGDGHVLHLRPLHFVEGAPNDDYYLWLAFEWRNIFYACIECLKAKGSQFPLDGDRADYLATFDEVEEQESRLLIDPTVEDPGRHLRFLTTGQCYPLSREGAATIELFNLNRDRLVSRRLELMRRLVDGLNTEDKDDSRDFARELLMSRAPHVAALHNFLRRVVAFWQPAGVDMRGTGDRFVRNLGVALRDSKSRESERFRQAVDAVIDEDRRAARAWPDYVPRRAVDERSRRARLRYPAAGNEISHIAIRSFKAIEHLDFDLKISRSDRAGAPCLMVLGENSAGKSSVLSAIALALIGRKEAMKFRKVMPKLVRSIDTNRFDQHDAAPVEVDISFHLSEHRAVFSYDPARRQIHGNKEPTTIVLAYGPRRFFDPKQRSHAEGAAARVRTLFNPVATIPYPGDWLRKQTGQRFDEIASALRVVLALDDDDELIIEPDHIAVRANGRVTPIDSLSEGYRSVFVMTVDIIRELLNHWDKLELAQAVVLIDELETHLHPRWKMQVMTALRRVLPRVQFIVTTHDPLCLRGMDDGEVEVLQRDENDRIRALNDLPSVGGMTAEQLLTSDYFGLSSTADPSTEIAFARLAGDVIRRSVSGDLDVAPAAATSELVERLTIGDSPTEQIVQEALQQYLEKREARDGVLRPELRAEAVKAVVAALTADRAE